VTNTGLVTAHAAGAAVITAIVSNVVGAAQIIVLPQGEFHGGQQPVAACAAFGRSGDTRRKQF
jgi:hypothetical protein